ncbi:MAG: type I restriction enzyme HsdR N-terminal domain-containing protein [Alistipes sp.]|jgi:hypothetical protein|nr:type I restriction enzyme HsdR N-terminal domain-containing protein [Alistipes sp.]
MAVSNYPELNFPAIRLRVRRVGDVLQAWDSLRGKYLVLTPEEWVRRHVVEYLIVHCNVQPLSIIEEFPVSLNGTAQRADIVVIGADSQPAMLVECKQPDVVIDQAVFDQAVRYNSVVGAQYVVLTNGLRHYCYQLSNGTYHPMKTFPQL